MLNKNEGMNILKYDIETSPILGFTWNAYEDNLLKIEKDSGLLAFAYMWNDGPITVLSKRLYSERQMVKILWELFNEADVIVAQNGDKFDIRWANRLFIKYKLKPPAPYKTVDTLKLARKYFKFTKNSLDYLSEILLGEKKIETNSKLWFDCMRGDTSALKEMEKYCIHDVKLLDGVYNKLKVWHTGHPNSNLYNNTTHKCPVCGGNTQKRGFMVTRAAKYQRFACTKCGAWSHGERIKSDKVIQ